jgi:single-strand DNA-binding protein
MASYNRTIVVGNLTRDPEKRGRGDTSIAEFGIAVNDRVKKGEQWVDEPTFLDVTLFGRTADVALEYLKKGSQCLIEGRLKQDNWDDKTTGQKRSKIKIVGDKLVMMGSKEGGGGRQQSSRQESNSDGFYDPPAEKAPAGVGAGSDDGDDGVPF